MFARKANGEPMLVDAKVIAEALDVSRTKVFDLASRGLIPSVRCGWRLKFDLSMVQSQLRKNDKRLKSLLGTFVRKPET